MTAPEVPWQIEPHTLAKHALYREYLGKWIPIMVQGAWKGDMTYAEGFAGPGVYKDGSPGSPVIALRALLDRRQLRGRFPAARFLFVDLDPRCTQLLEQKRRTPSRWTSSPSTTSTWPSGPGRASPTWSSS